MCENSGRGRRVNIDEGKRRQGRREVEVGSNGIDRGDGVHVRYLFGAVAMLRCHSRCSQGEELSAVRKK